MRKAKKEVGLFDLVVDGVGGKEFNHFLELLKMGGKLVSYGATSGTFLRSTFNIKEHLLTYRYTIFS